MTVKGEAHVLINGIEYLLDESVDEHYVHEEPSLDPRRYSIDYTGDPDANKRGVHMQRLTWAITDWTGGENTKPYSQDDPTVYFKGIGSNPRFPGQLTGHPKRHVSSKTVTDATKYAKTCVGAGGVWIGCSKETFFDDDGTGAYTAGQSSAVANMAVTAMCADTAYLYVTYYKTTGSNNSNDRLILRTPAYGTAYTSITTASNSTVETSKAAIRGMAIHNGRLWTWTGQKLHSYDVKNGSFPLVFNDSWRQVYDTGADIDGSPFNESYHADLFDCGNSVVMFVATLGRSEFYQMKDGVCRPLWQTPVGFTCKAACYSNGIVYATGHYGGNDNTGANKTGTGGVWALPLDTLRPYFLTFARQHLSGSGSISLQECAPSYGDQILVQASFNGKMFVYDANYDAISMLDDMVNSDLKDEDGTTVDFTLDNHRLGKPVTFLGHRIFPITEPKSGGSPTTLQILDYEDDMPAQRATLATTGKITTETNDWDFNYPDQTKALFGFHVTFMVEGSTTSGLIAGQRIKVEYAKDDGVSPSYTTADTITSSTTPSGTKGRVFIQVSTSSSTVKFNRLRVRVTLDNNGTASTQVPVLYGITAEAELLAQDEIWTLLLRMKDENAGTRPTRQARKSNQLRDNIVALREAKSLVAFVDGYIYREDGRVPSTKTVIVDSFKDIINRNAEGTMQVVLRAVPL